MSIDGPIPPAQPGSDVDSGFNYIDTYVEFVAEVILKYDNAIPESKDRQQKELQQHKQFEKAIEEKELVASPVVWQDTITILPDHPENMYAFQFIKEIHPPPPRA